MIEHAVKLPEREQPERSDQGEKGELVAGKDNAPARSTRGQACWRNEKQKQSAPSTVWVRRALERLGHPLTIRKEEVKGKRRIPVTNRRFCIGQKRLHAATRLGFQRREQDDAGTGESAAPSRGWNWRKFPCRKSGLTTSSSASRKPRSAAPTSTFITGTRGPRKRSRCRW